MRILRDEIELLAPVGSYETLVAAIQGKADAVYFGIGELNMRSKSTINFSIEDLKYIVKICVENNVRSYITLNSVMYDEDTVEIREIIDACKDLGVNAIIASDISVLSYAYSKGLQVHISTQLNVSNIETIKFFSKFADVFVLARELSLKQIKFIYNEIINQKIIGPSGKIVKIEIFAHGSLCMAISGKCYLSLHEFNHSANRGECFQACRRAYNVYDKETGSNLEIDNEYIMSPKDLCTINFLDKIVESGVKILKIEGRARSAEYVKTVTQCYDEALNVYISGLYNENKKSELMSRLSSVYNRGFWDGYYLGNKMGEWNNVHGSKATKKKVYIGKCLNYFTNIKVAEFIIETGTINTEDEILVIGPTTGVIESVIKDIRVNLLSAQSAIKGEKFSIYSECRIRRSDKLYKLIPIIN
jgi:U32 family peptidase